MLLTIRKYIKEICASYLLLCSNYLAYYLTQYSQLRNVKIRTSLQKYLLEKLTSGTDISICAQSLVLCKHLWHLLSPALVALPGSRSHSLFWQNHHWQLQARFLLTQHLQQEDRFHLPELSTKALACPLKSLVLVTCPYL